jgi:hypothetical protein
MPPTIIDPRHIHIPQTLRLRQLFIGILHLHMIIHYKFLDLLLRPLLLNRRLKLRKLQQVLLEQLDAGHAELRVYVLAEGSRYGFVGFVDLHEVLFGEVVVLGALLVGVEGFG